MHGFERGLKVKADGKVIAVGYVICDEGLFSGGPGRTRRPSCL